MYEHCTYYCTSYVRTVRIKYRSQKTMPARYNGQIVREASLQNLNITTLPVFTMARERARSSLQTRPLESRGRRTNVQLNSKNIPVNSKGHEEFDAYFPAASSSPNAENRGSNTTRKSARFSLDTHGGDVSVSSMNTANQKTLRRIALGSKQTMSPSEISRVSTAPPVASKEAEEIEEARLSKQYQDDEPERLAEDVASPEPLPTSNDDADVPLDDDIHPALKDISTPDSPLAVDSPVDAPTQTEVDFPMQDDVSEDEDEGPGYEMADHDPNTPESAKVLNKAKGKKKEHSVPESDGSTSEPKSILKKKKSRKKSKNRVAFSPQGIPAGPREYETIPIDQLTQEPVEGLRRSRRARVAPLQFWKNEKLVYGPNDFDEDVFSGVAYMSVVTAVSKAQPTPYKKRKFTPVVSEEKKNKRSKATAEVENFPPYDASKLLRKYKYVEGNRAHVWDEIQDSEDTKKVVAFYRDADERQLPLSKKREKSEGTVVGIASQGFNEMNEGSNIHAGYIMGHLCLPRKGIKDPESVGSCAQVFTVVSGQEGAIEVAYSCPDEVDGDLDPKTAQRFLLGPGDIFRIPPANTYRLQNHSRDMDCLLTWTIIRPKPVSGVDTPSR